MKKPGSTPLVEGADYYWEKGLVVLTESHHRKRGYCCGAGCRHCPFQYDAVPEPKRSLLRKQNIPPHGEEKGS